MKVAALDLGSNTFLCLIAEVEKGRVTRVDHDQVEMVRLGQDVQKTKQFHPDALIRAEKALQKFRVVIDQHKPERILAMATSAARDVTNGDELFSICKKLDIPLQIIPGGKEAQITFQGAVSASGDQKSRLVVDIGGGSTEFIFGVGHNLKWGKSLDIGCVRLKERFGDDLERVRGEVEGQLSSLQVLGGFDASFACDEILTVAGTPTEIARIEVGKFDVAKIDGYRLTSSKLENWIVQFQKRKPAEITKDFGVDPGRADVLLIGVLILRETLRFWKKDELVVSTRGVRYGVAMEVAK